MFMFKTNDYFSKIRLLLRKFKCNSLYMLILVAIAVSKSLYSEVSGNGDSSS